MLSSPLKILKEVRAGKLKKILSLGLDPYPETFPLQLSVAEVRQKNLGTAVALAGRLRSWRSHGAIVFADLFDSSGKIQLFFETKNLKEPQKSLLELLDLGDLIGVQGELFRTQAGELTVRGRQLTLLAKALRPLPSSWHGLREVEERYRQRYVDLLLNDKVRQIFFTRAKIVGFLRDFLRGRGFLEVETPVLQPLYGGATARPFLTRHEALDCNLYLRIADELYLKRLVVAGFEKVFEVGKDFRNEGIDREHNPEFTMLEFYWAYATYEDLMTFTEEMFSALIKEIRGGTKIVYQGEEYDFKTPWPRLTFAEAMRRETGIDLTAISEEQPLREAIEKQGLRLDLEGVVGIGPLLDQLYKKIVRPKLKGPLFLTDHPAAMRPLAKRKKENPALSASFQLLAGGMELINAYNELNDPREQRIRWEEELTLAKKGLREYQVLDEDYLRALEYGLPPTAGWGLGVDRLVALLTDCHSIKETILFPTLRPESPSP